MIAFTNHALDHMLCSVLDAKITTDIVRLGSRTSEERISQYSIETREMAAGQSRLHPTYTEKYKELHSVGVEITKLIKSINETDLESDSSEIVKYISLSYPEHHVAMAESPSWISVAKGLAHDGDAESGARWQRLGRKGLVIDEDTSIYAFWKNCGDLDFLEMIASPVASNIEQTGPPPAHPDPGPFNRFEHLLIEVTSDSEDTDSLGEKEEKDDDNEDDFEVLPEKLWMRVCFSTPPGSSADAAQVEASVPLPEPSVPIPPIADTRPSYVSDSAGFFEALGEDGIPTVPQGDRGLDQLLEEAEVWNMSRYERQTLHVYWIDQARAQMQQNQRDEFERLRKKHAEKVQEHNEIREEVSRARLGGLLV